MPASEGALAMELLALVEGAGPAGLIHVAASEGRAERLAHLLRRLAPGIDVALFPPWDCMPFDHASPSARSMGLRVAALMDLSRPRERPWLLLATPDALLQRVPPRDVWSGASRTLEPGDAVDPVELSGFLASIGYWTHETVDEVGELAATSAVIDVFPAGYASPVRIDHAEGRIATIASFEAATQRTTDCFQSVHLRPVSEAILRAAEDGSPAERAPGIEHRLPDLYPALETLLALAPKAIVSFDERAGERGASFAEQVREAHESRLAFDKGGARPLAPERLYLDLAERDRSLADREVVTYVEAETEAEPDVPLFALAARPVEALATFVRTERESGRRVLIAGPDRTDLNALSQRLGRALAERPTQVADWTSVLAAPRGALLQMALPLTAGFVTPDIAVIAVADVLGSRATPASGPSAGTSPFDGEDLLRIGDAVIHLVHGVGRLEGLETVDAGETAPAETIRLSYAGGAKLMVPVDEVELIWRYGAGESIAPDRLDGLTWPKRRAGVEAEMRDAAAALARLADERRARKAATILPPRRDYERFVATFPFNETPDQRAAAAEVLADLGSGRVMERLVCGDVGFGKTEVALRAAAAVALAGRQVAIVAPTTVLVRQHLNTFSRRFAGLGIEIGHLSRLATSAEARAAKAGLKDGSLLIAIGTQALAAKDVAFRDLALLIIDEEQRFGTADKAKLKALGRDTHVLALTATPIPRTLQGALAGLQDVSLLTTPPALRQPIRTIVRPLDEATLRDALIRERRRAGQSFVVCPRIEDIGPMAERLRRLAPELDLRIAHGKLPAGEIDATMIDFANGRGDVLLATNIIESGLDVPRANTIVIWRADRFGLAQLHQLRGRVGRGRARGVAYLWTDPDSEVPVATLKRLETLASLDRLGAGFEISSEDLDQRGAGDLLGDTQAGHVKLIGSGLYRRLLERALLMARGGEPGDEWVPQLNIGIAGRIPDEYVPEPELRLTLYARAARSRTEDEQARLREELEDRFGPLPRPVCDLLIGARLRRLCREAGVARVDAGPGAIALTFKERSQRDEHLGALVEREPDLEWRGERLVRARAIPEEERMDAISALLEAAAPD